MACSGPGPDGDYGHDPVRRFDGHVEADVAALAVADDGGAPHPERVHHGPQIGPIAVLDIVGCRGAEAAEVVANHPVSG